MIDIITKSTDIIKKDNEQFYFPSSNKLNLVHTLTCTHVQVHSHTQKNSFIISIFFH